LAGNPLGYDTIVDPLGNSGRVALIGGHLLPQGLSSLIQLPAFDGLTMLVANRIAVAMVVIFFMIFLLSLSFWFPLPGTIRATLRLQII
jgi:hypothetical protein